MKDVSFRYFPGSPFEVEVLRKVSLVIHKGESIGIIGRTGCGKSTLIQHMNALLLPESGVVLIDGKETGKKGPKLRQIRQQVGLVFQYPEHQIFEETVYAEVAFGPKNMGITGSELEETVHWAMDSVGLDYKSFKDKNPFELSGGQMRRVAIAGVLSMRPEVLILDEPTAGLDPEGRKSILEKVVSLRREWGMTVVIVSHSMEDLARFSERILVMDNGDIKLDGPVRETFSRHEELEQYGVRPPVTTRTAILLRKRGFEVPTGILSSGELADEIIGILSARRKRIDVE